MFNSFFAGAGNLTSDPKIGRSEGGTDWAFMTIAVTPRVKTADGGWGDGATSFIDIKAFGMDARDIKAAGAKKGQRVIVVGSIREEDKTKDGISYRRHAVIADELGFSTRFASSRKDKGEVRSETDIESEMNAEADGNASTTSTAPVTSGASRFEDDEDEG